jgi:hypothetical protein
MIQFILTAVLIFQERSIEQLVEELDSDSAESREVATVELIKRGEKALLKLQLSMKAASPESRRRIQRVLESIADNSAEELLKKLEKKLLDARSFSLSYTSESVVDTSETTVTVKSKGALFIKFPNKLLAEEQETILRGGEGQPLIAKSQFVSNGGKMRLKIHARESKELKPPANMIKFLAGNVSRLGAFGVQDALRFAYLKETPNRLDRDPQKIYTRSAAKAGEKEGIANTLTFSITGEMAQYATVTVKLWIDPERLTLLKRSQETQAVGGEVRHGKIMETYEDFSIDCDISDEKFELTEPGK